MKNIETELLGFNVPVIGVCETLAELISAAGSEDVVVQDNNRQVLAHSHYGVLRNTIVATLEKATGVLRKTAKNKNLVGKDDEDEKQGAYIARLSDEIGDEEVNKHADAIKAACEAIPVDYKPGTRGSGETAKPAAKWLAYWDAAKEKGELDRRLAQFGIDTTLPEDEQKVKFANAVKAKVLAKQRELEKSALDV